MFYFRARDEGHYPVRICTFRNELRFLGAFQPRLTAARLLAMPPSSSSAFLAPSHGRQPSSRFNHALCRAKPALTPTASMRRPILSFLPFPPLPSRPCTHTIEHAIVALNESIGAYPWLEICTYAILMMT
ncbi:hypothetical protein GGE12_004121 [Rhizobium mongolense]|uniref:Uncharacterized protein n=1 Tax=Rhizobium mongolense TaxID=57676 RepID=A0A7W6RPL2_9HYPH|nr:hypothetical protein [Rhizobium mongolense]